MYRQFAQALRFFARRNQSNAGKTACGVKSNFQIRGNGNVYEQTKDGCTLFQLPGNIFIASK